jgi:hypothetical protein
MRTSADHGQGQATIRVPGGGAGQPGTAREARRSVSRRACSARMDPGTAGTGGWCQQDARQPGGARPRQRSDACRAPAAGRRARHTPERRAGARSRRRHRRRWPSPDSGARAENAPAQRQDELGRITDAARRAVAICRRGWDRRQKTVHHDRGMLEHLWRRGRVATNLEPEAGGCGHARGFALGNRPHVRRPRVDRARHGPQSGPGSALSGALPVPVPRLIKRVAAVAGRRPRSTQRGGRGLVRPRFDSTVQLAAGRSVLDSALAAPTESSSASTTGRERGSWAESPRRQGSANVAREPRG